MVILDISIDIGVPSRFISMTQQNQLIQPKGCGTSLNREYAVERALLESLQPVHIHNKKLRDDQSNIITNLSCAPLLLRCAIADVKSIAKNILQVGFDSLPSCNNHLNLHDQFQLIKTKIQSKGFSIYYKIISELFSGFTCVKYHIPKF